VTSYRYFARRWHIFQPGKRTRALASRKSAIQAMRDLGWDSGAVLRDPRGRTVPRSHIWVKELQETAKDVEETARFLQCRVYELEHAIWHALDDSEEHSNGDRTIRKQDAEKLSALVPEDRHPILEENS